MPRMKGQSPEGFTVLKDFYSPITQREYKAGETYRTDAVLRRLARIQKTCAEAGKPLAEPWVQDNRRPARREAIETTEQIYLR